MLESQMLGIDPGPRESAAVALIQGRIDWYFYGDNEVLLEKLAYWRGPVALEGLECYGQPVGRSIFDTAFWLGRFFQASVSSASYVRIVSRREVKIFLGARNDKEVRAALVAIFGAPGTKRSPGATYGLYGDLWSALAVAHYSESTRSYVHDQPTCQKGMESRPDSTLPRPTRPTVGERQLQDGAG